ncbi:MAG: SDR family NAD(P)-dependent oxidoreductase [Bradymonadales bacterium]|nr:MAG: SDR family NAD(P)-dependent oxidoreductase [Bradymonadales bacterium]
MTTFENLKVLVTGASSGIGRATAQLLAERGAEVYALARRKDRLLKLQEENPKNIHPIVQDLNEGLAAIKSQVDLSQIGVLVNNSGLALGTDPIQELETEAVRQMFETNVLSLIELSQAVISEMLKRGGGDIVNIGSVAGSQTYAGGSVYCATKFAVRALTEAWRKDLLGKNIRVIGIHPGMVETEFSEVRFKGDRERAKAVYQGFDALTSEDVAEAIVWSLSCPRRVNVESLLLMPTAQAAVGQVARRST